MGMWWDVKANYDALRKRRADEKAWAKFSVAERLERQRRYTEDRQELYQLYQEAQKQAEGKPGAARQIRREFLDEAKYLRHAEAAEAAEVAEATGIDEPEEGDSILHRAGRFLAKPVRDGNRSVKASAGVGLVISLLVVILLVRAAVSPVRDANGQATTRFRLLGSVLSGHADMKVTS